MDDIIALTFKECANLLYLHAHQGEARAKLLCNRAHTGYLLGKTKETTTLWAGDMAFILCAHVLEQIDDIGDMSATIAFEKIREENFHDVLGKRVVLRIRPSCAAVASSSPL